MDVRAPEQTTKGDGYDMVLRFRVDPEKQPDFGRSLSEIIRPRHLINLFGGKVEVGLRVLQPVIGPQPAAWELRITVPSLGQLGELLDWASRPGSSPSGERRTSVLNELLTIDGAEVIHDGVPLYRTWRIV